MGHSASWHPGLWLCSELLAVTVSSRVQGQVDLRHLCRDQDSGSLCPSQSGPDERQQSLKFPIVTTPGTFACNGRRGSARWGPERLPARVTPRRKEPREDGEALGDTAGLQAHCTGGK